MMNSGKSDVSGSQFCALLFVIALFGVQALILVNIMNVNFMLNMLELLSDAKEGLFSPNMIFIVVGPWVAITITCALSLWFIQKQRLAVSYLLAASPIIGAAVSVWAWSAIPTNVFMLSDSPRRADAAIWMPV